MLDDATSPPGLVDLPAIPKAEAALSSPTPSTPLAAATPDHLLTPDNRAAALRLLDGVLRTGVDFKLGQPVYTARLDAHELRDRLVRPLADNPVDLTDLLAEFGREVLPYCKNEASPQFLGFGDTGADLAALAGGLLALLTQQNLINQDFDSPSATFCEIAALRWLREMFGYLNPPVDRVQSVWHVGGVVTHGGTASNAAAMMLAREHAVPGTMHSGVRDPGRFAVLVPAGIGHYSVASALAWIGCGAQVVPVATAGFRYDLPSLHAALTEHRGRVMAVVAYCGDSRTQTLEDLRGVHDLVRGHDERIWLHADACWGLMAALTPRLAHRLDGICGYDSITVDPHKVLDIPYSLSALLVRDPDSMRAIASHSDLIMQEEYAFGQATPFVGSRGWASLMLWLAMRAHGRTGLAALVDRRLDLTARCAQLIDEQPRLMRLHDPDMTAIAFVYLPAGFDPAHPDIDAVNAVNAAIHARMLDEGAWYLHQFTLPDAQGRIQPGAVLRPLRFVGCNTRITEQHLVDVLAHVVTLGAAVDSVAGDRSCEPGAVR